MSDVPDDRAVEAADELLAELGERSSAGVPERGGRLAPGSSAETAHEGLHD